jgi:L,D-peptidoglycan transpeptidase YkuD (ErfK/YbiS/YcfS/YnhG family)
MLRRAILAVLLAAGPAAVALPATAQAAPSRFMVPASARQLIVVSSPTYDPPGYLAALTVLRRRDSGAPWRRALGRWPAETGYGHLRDARREGDGSTPTGVYGIETTIYGVQPRPAGLHYAYHRLVCGDWWDEDPFTRDYNEFVHLGCDVAPAFASWSETLWTETVAYPYFAVLRFNVDPVRGGAGAPGSGIFIHSWVGGPTAGCIALHRRQLLALLRWLRPSRHPVVAIGTDAELAGLAA